MAPLPSRKSLESMKRADLQKLCKDYGVKANLKSEALIDLLLDTIKPAAAHAPARRSVSTRHSSRAGPSRISSIVIHNTDDDEEDEGEESAEDKHSTDGRESDIQSSLRSELTPPATRTRKGKEQTRLGVGRPVAAGGSGPRAVTKSLSVSKKRSKGSRSMKPTEATIVEEEVELETNEPRQDSPLDGIPSQGQVQHASTKSTTPEDSIESLASVDKRVADALRPLHEQMKSMKSELELMQALKVELKELKAQVDEMGSLREKVETLTATVRDLRKEADESASLRVELKQFKESLVKQATPSTPKSQTTAVKKRAGPSGFGFPPSLLRQQSSSSVTPGPSTSATNHSTRPHPGIASSMLGKRPRDFTTSDIEEDNQDDEMPVDNPAKAETKLARKRPKFSQEDEGSATTSGAGGLQEAVAEEEQEEEDSESALAFRVPSFTVFSGLDELPTDFIDPPPPTEHLPDFFTPPSPPVGSEAPDVPRQGRATTSTANAAENQQPFAFSFQPITSTPAHGMFLPSFPYPEPPQSPSPAGTNPTAFLNQNQLGRSDVFQSFGFPPPGRPPRTTGLRNTSGLAGGFIDPAALSRLPSDQVTGPSSDTAARTTDSGSSTGMGAASETPQLKRTMYGTELEGDTRFGDFGVEGVGNTKGGFWAGGRY